MPTIKLSDESKRYIERHVGLNVAEIKRLTVDELDANIGRKVGKKIEVAPPSDARVPGRGSVLLHRLSKTSEVDRRLSEI